MSSSTDPKIRAAWCSVAVSLIALGMKYAAWRVTDSIALYSDAIETIINVVSAVAGLWALRVASLPPDHNHTYGHYKAEYLSAVAEGVLVVITAITIAHEAWIGFRHMHAPQDSWLGIALNGGAGVLNLVWGLFLLRLGRARHSPALVASGHHVLSDVWTSAVLITGFVLIPLTGFLWLDPLLAALIAVNVLRTGWEMMRTSIAGLMDEAPNSETLGEIRSIISHTATGAMEAHDIRARIVGAMTFIEFHLVVPGAMSVEEAHHICDRVEEGLRAGLGDALINIHVEPERKAKHTGVLVLP
ncbi:cation transporter [Komagataeibacter sp. AV436]|uniref:Cation transporter n=1 Tax=Komagataeibacter melomenusus TaxID=2766578 RepID=A0ABX2ADW7_9PROT|nr:cation diffusion facilitator family transporter [Komagataeibacter melomenusus]MBV1831997.1 cation diffusion facilitator family transporter [Komagataeibacter melomenusus]NPC66495.1 cation transporter [Komagataeibacter melomenusus]